MLVGKGEREDVASGSDCHVLNSRHGITHRRSPHNLAGIEMPQDTASLGFHRFEGVRVVCEEDQSSGGGQRTAPGIALTYLLVAPGTFAMRHRERQQKFLHALTRGKEDGK